MLPFLSRFGDAQPAFYAITPQIRKGCIKVLTIGGILEVLGLILTEGSLNKHPFPAELLTEDTLA